MLLKKLRTGLPKPLVGFRCNLLFISGMIHQMIQIWFSQMTKTSALKKLHYVLARWLSQITNLSVELLGEEVEDDFGALNAMHW